MRKENYKNKTIETINQIQSKLKTLDSILDVEKNKQDITLGDFQKALFTLKMIERMTETI